MCADCGDFNYAKRPNRRCKGQVAVITGSRKIGYHITLMLLRGGATVIATRFPVDSALRFSKEDDFMEDIV
jgi:NAD(P)-dependent dehydrogenase (short-subunit alcohol dehydrogenase family)